MHHQQRGITNTTRLSLATHHHTPMTVTKGKKKGVVVRPQVRVSTTKYTANGGRVSGVQTLKPGAGKKRHDETQKELQEQYAALPASARLTLNQIRDFPEAERDWEDLPEGANDLDNILAGANGLMESGAGGEFLDTLEENLRAERQKTRKRRVSTMIYQAAQF